MVRDVIVMVQREVKQKTRVYGTVAVLSAMILVSLIYVFGTVPGIFPPDEFPSILAMENFKSYDELKNFLVTNTKDGSINYFSGGPLDVQVFESRAGFGPETMPPPAPMGDTALDSSDISFSTTNIQVSGVDESDIVKTDGKYIYVATTNNYYPTIQNNIYIVKADPLDPRVIAEINLDNGTYVAGLFLSQDTNKLVVLGSQYQLYDYLEPRFDFAIYPYFSSVNTTINVFDISDKAHPTIARNLTLSGSYFNSRMIGNYLYAVVSQPAYNIYEDEILLPQVIEKSEKTEISPKRIYYADTVDTYFTFTTFVGVNVLDDFEQISNMTILMGGSSTMYVSVDNLYVTYSTWNNGQYTSIYRVSIDGSELTFESKGSVPGYVLNQYSMDEYNDYFRIATTWQNVTQVNNLYVLDMNMSLIGKLENLAENERIYSVRFMGDKSYMVTFRQIDPFFVLDLSNPVEPKVAGELKIPGFSSYLHPYDENHIIGLGKEDSSVKLSLFDVTNAYDPKETSKYLIESEWTDSQALNDPKAFLFDKEKQLLVIPVSTTNYGVIDIKENETLSEQGGFWQGAYVFTSTANDFILKGRITHIDDGTAADYYWADSPNWVNRAIYINNYLYTISNSKVKINNLETLDFIDEVELS
jgi:uncharacterized secreted protein with C-terminal beta-propeller domain